jgi:cyclohexyl-isocyanide hydratase
MKVAFIIYDGLTTLDFIGVYDPVTRLKTMGFMADLEYEVVALQDKIVSGEGLELIPNRVGEELSAYDYIIVPGGNGIADLMNDKVFSDWLRTAGDKTTVAAVCGGSLLLGAAGMLQGKKATTHPALFSLLENFVAKASPARIVEDGNIITARGVTSALDLGLFLCEKIAGSEVREKIQKQMDYLNYTYI